MVKQPSPSINGKILAGFVLLLCSFLGISSSPAKADLKVPAEYGEVIFRCNTESPNQLFIIGLYHRDALTRTNGTNGPRVQAEIYKVGDWLIHQQGCKLLLPEGFFKTGTAEMGKERVLAKPIRDDMKSLEERLGDNRKYVIAEMLLKEDHPLRLQQVEDKALFDAVGSGLSRLVNSTGSTADYLSIKSQLDYLQERRTAAMLQKIPEVIDQEFQQGSIKNRKAIFTIGLSHLYKIIDYLNQSRIAVYSPLFTSDKSEDYVAELALFKKNFGVSVILPRTLADDQKILEATQLEKVVVRYRGPSLPVAPNSLH